MIHVIENSVTIDAPPFEVWRALTDPDLMKQWMAEPEMRLRIITDWKVGSPIIVKGHHNNVDFENKGTVLQFEANSILRYSHLSSVSELPDEAENYTVIEFRLARTEDDSTSLYTRPGAAGSRLSCCKARCLIFKQIVYILPERSGRPRRPLP